MKATTDNNKQVWLCFNKVLFAKTDSRPDLTLWSQFPLPYSRRLLFYLNVLYILDFLIIFLLCSLWTQFICYAFFTLLSPSPGTMIYPLWTFIFLDFQTSWQWLPAHLYSHYPSGDGPSFLTYLYWSPSLRATVPTLNLPFILLT